MGKADKMLRGQPDNAGQFRGAIRSETDDSDYVERETTKWGAEAFSLGANDLIHYAYSDLADEDVREADLAAALADYDTDGVEDIEDEETFHGEVNELVKAAVAHRKARTPESGEPKLQNLAYEPQSVEAGHLRDPESLRDYYAGDETEAFQRSGVRDDDILAAMRECNVNGMMRGIDMEDARKRTSRAAEDARAIMGRASELASAAAKDVERR